MNRRLRSVCAASVGVLLTACAASAQSEPVLLELMPPATAENPGPVAEKRVLEVVFCIDCSGSMTHAMDRAKAVIRGILDELRQQNPGAELRVGFVRYGDATRTYRVFDFTADKASIEQTLTSTSVANVGAEFLGVFLATATEKLSWSKGSAVSRKIYMVGNETAAQGPVDYRVATKYAVRNGIQVNVVYCPLIREERDIAFARTRPSGRGTDIIARKNASAGAELLRTQNTWLETAYLGGGEVFKLVDGPQLAQRWTPIEVRYLVEVVIPNEDVAALNAEGNLRRLEQYQNNRPTVRRGRP